MNTPNNLDETRLVRLCQQAQQAAVCLKEEIEERKGIAASVRLEREFGNTIRFNPRPFRSSPTNSVPGQVRHSKTRLLGGSRHVSNFWLPVVIRRGPRSEHGTRHLTFKIEAIPRALVKRRLKSGTVIGPGSAEAGARYSVGERSAYLIGERNQKGADGGAYIHSNIDDDPEKCCEFFATVERNERQPSLDQVTIDMGRSPALLRRVANHPECEPAVIAAYRADPNGTATIELRRGADTLKRILHECDDRPRAKGKAEQKERDGEDGVKWRLGRGGRTQWRIVVSFPWNFTAAQRQEALHFVCDHFAEMGCMYMGVIHEASASNDWRNDHAHIDIYDRPCRRLTGDEHHDLANVPERWIADVRKEYRAKAYRKDTGRWDFEVEREAIYESGNKRTHKIFGANKSLAMRRYSVPNDSRRAVAAIINKITMRDFGQESVHHQSYAELGIAKQPDEPLGPKDHALQGKGRVSDVGLRNELRHTEFGRQEIEARYRHRRAHLLSLSVDYLKRTSEHRETGARLKEREAASTALSQEEALAELTRDAELLQLEVQRQLSSAYHVIRTSGRVIRKGDDKRGDYAVRREEARRYWRTWVKDHADVIAVLKDLKAYVRSLENRPSLDKLISAVFAPQVAGEKASTRQPPSLEPALAILPTKRMNALLHSRSTEPDAQQVTAQHVVPSPLQDPAAHAEPPVLQKREAARPLMVVPPLSKLPEAIVDEALEKDAIAQPDAGVNVGHKQDSLEPALPILPTKRMNALLQSSSTEPDTQQVTARYVVPNPLGNPAVHTEPSVLQKRDAATPLLVILPLSKTPETVVAEPLEKEAVVQPDARVDVDLKQTNVLVSTVGSRSRSGKDERLDGSEVPHIDASLTLDQAGSSPGVRLPPAKLDTRELALKLAAGARSPIDGHEVPATSVRRPDRAEVADEVLATPGVAPGLSQNPVGHAEATAVQADEAVFRPLVVPPLAAQAEATPANALLEKERTSRPNIPASTIKHADRGWLPQEQAFEAAQTEKLPGEALPPQLCDAIAVRTNGGMPTSSGTFLPPRSYYRELARRLAQGPDPEANRALEPRARTNNQSSVKKRGVERPTAKALADATPWGGLARGPSVKSTNSSGQPGALKRSAADDLYRHEPKPEDSTAIAETESGQGPELQTSPEDIPSIKADDATVGAVLAKPSIDEWDELNLNEMDTRDEIIRDKRSLVLRDGKVAFAKPEAASDPHRRFLADFPRAAHRLFAEQQSRLQLEQEKYAFLQRDTGLA